MEFCTYIIQSYNSDQKNKINFSKREVKQKKKKSLEHKRYSAASPVASLAFDTSGFDSCMQNVALPSSDPYVIKGQSNDIRVEA